MKEEKRTEWRKSLLGTGLLLFGFFAFQTAAARRMYIPSGSMMPTLENGDQILVSKYPYGLSYASLPFHGATVLPGRLFGRVPERGDIVTVARRVDGEDMIKRVIGLPGDVVEVREGRLILNGRVVPRVARGGAHLPVDAHFPCDDPREVRFRTVAADGRIFCDLPVYRETLPNGVRYDTIDLGVGVLDGGYVSPGDNYGPVRVPAGHVFLMGDNRDDSADSRFPLESGGLGGPVPLESVSGRAEILTHSYDGRGSIFNPVSWFTTTRAGRYWISLRPERTGQVQ